jgi:ubiquinone/menaquinone biosynthesis C-methylase UbiE
MLTPKRIYEEELLDAGAGTDDDVAESLSDLRRINRYLGGTGVVIESLNRILGKERPDEISLLDVGTGSADIPEAVVEWCRSRGIKPRVAALDISERNLRVARARLGLNPDVTLLCADSLNLPFARASFDIVTASLFLHHFVEDDVVRMLRNFSLLARRAVIVNDLVRNFIPYYFMRIAGPIITTSYLSRNDGPVSVLRGFTASELQGLALRAGFARIDLKQKFPYRLSMVARLG